MNVVLSQSTVGLFEFTANDPYLGIGRMILLDENALVGVSGGLMCKKLFKFNREDNVRSLPLLC
jgi:hypothetical protein